LAIWWPTAAARTPLETRAWLRTVGRPGPESWVWPVAAAALAVLVWGSFGWFPLGAGFEGGYHHHMGMSPAHNKAGPVGELAGHLVLWVAMVGATMLPLVAGNLRGVGLRSPRARRIRATAEVATGWALVWLAFGAGFTVALAVTGPVVPAALIIGVATAAVAWQFTAIKRVAVARCHRRFAPPLGAAATPACLRFGRSLGRDCLLSCWPTMVMMTVAGHQVLAVAALGWLSWRDRRRPHDRPGRLVSVLVLGGVAAATLVGRI
jgi:predicted metal-binding membrane protein